ncbi:zinc finger protein ZFAT-like protein [Aphelenchoides avenae]|nr:zinc finger protein ZFAT-like protein [Aphelenchus avenae]
MRFKFYTRLKSHENTHGPQGHKCTICSYGTVSKKNLRNHMLQHADSRQHRWDQCSASYNTKASLIVHKKKHSPDAYLKCDACNYRTSEMCQMKRHLQTPKHLKNQENVVGVDNGEEDVSADADDSGKV